MRQERNWRRTGAALAGLMMVAGCGTATAQKTPPTRDLGAPSVLKPQGQEARDEKNPKGYNLLSLGALETAIKDGKELHYVLPIQYTSGKIYNPATGKDDAVTLRSYGNAFLAPTIVMNPGQTVRISLANKLDPEPGCGLYPNTEQPLPINQPHCSNDTNLHSHGLWVSPTGNSDNVLLNLKPGVQFQYEYNVPEDHPAGTFWYHPHKHGSTSMQVGSGMAGALVVKGSRPPTMVSNGDLDTLLAPFAPVGGAEQEVMLIQQIPYACFDKDGNIQKDPVTKRWICKDGDIGKVNDFAKQFAPTAWKESGRYTMFNGVVRGTEKVEPGRIYRWRLIHAGVEETINLRIRKVGSPTKLLSLVKGDKEQAEEVKSACTGPEVTQYEVATDGLTRPSIYAKGVNNLQPGYRSDVLIVLPDAGDYCVYDDGGGEQIVSDDNAKIIGFLHAEGTATVADTTAFVKQQLLASADNLPEPVRTAVKADLNNDLKLTKYVPHQDVSDAELARYKQPVVKIQFNLIPGSGTTPTLFLINGKSYDPEVMNQTLVLGTAQEWKISSLNVSHPFHIHVNPFEVVSIRKQRPDGTEGDEVDTGIYAGMKGTWRDTIMTADKVGVSKDPVIITLRTRYNRYIGQYVLHCHILDHEDQGMMQNVQIVLPDADGKAMPQGHH